MNNKTKYIFWTKDGKFETYNWGYSRYFNFQITSNKGVFYTYHKLHSPDDYTPAWMEIETGNKEYWYNGKLHCEWGPALTVFNEFYLHGKFYGKNIEKYLKDHPNQNEKFQTEMLIKWKNN